MDPDAILNKSASDPVGQAAASGASSDAGTQAALDAAAQAAAAGKLYGGMSSTVPAAAPAASASPYSLGAMGLDVTSAQDLADLRNGGGKPLVRDGAMLTPADLAGTPRIPTSPEAQFASADGSTSFSAPDPSKFGGKPAPLAEKAPVASAAAAPKQLPGVPALLQPTILDSYTAPAAVPATKKGGIDWGKVGAVAKKLGVGVLDALNAFGSGYSGANYPTNRQLALNRQLELQKQSIQNAFTAKLSDIQTENAMRQAAQAQGFNLQNITAQQAADIAKIAAGGDINKQIAYINWWGRLHQPNVAPNVYQMYGSSGMTPGM